MTDLAEWMRTRLARAAGDDPITHWLAWPAPPGPAGEVGTPKGEPLIVLETREDLTELAAILTGELAEDAEQASGTVARYVIQGRRQSGDLVRARRVVSLQAGGGGATEGAAPTEPATPTGVLAQLMRHQEATQRQAAAALDTGMRAVALAAEALQRMAESSQAASAGAIREHARLEAARAERDERTREGEFRRELVGGAVGEALDLVREFVPDVRTALRTRALARRAAPPALPAPGPASTPPEIPTPSPASAPPAPPDPPELPDLDEETAALVARVTESARARGVALTPAQAAAILGDVLGGGA